MSSVTEQKLRKICIAHICTACGSPVVLQSAMVGRLWSSAIISPSLDKYLDKLENDIQNFAQQRKSLGKYGGEYSEEELKNRDEWVTGNTAVAIMIPYVEEGCPYCGYKEAWQHDKASESQLAEVPEAGFPQLINGSSRAELWAKEKLLSAIQNIHADHLNPKAVANAINRRRILLEQLQAEQTELNERPLKQKLDAIEKRMALLEEQVKQLGTFNFKEKKPINQQIDKLREEMLSTRSQLYRREKELKASIPNLKTRADWLSLTVSDVTDQAELHIAPYSYAYHPIRKGGNNTAENTIAGTDNIRGKSKTIPIKQEQNGSSLLLKPGTVIANRYRIDGVLGKGKYGVSYYAVNSQHVQLVLIEYLPCGAARRKSDGVTLGPLSQEKQSIYDDGKAEFLDDVRSLHALGEDGYYAKILDYFEWNGTVYCVSEYLEKVDPGRYIPIAFYGM